MPCSNNITTWHRKHYNYECTSQMIWSISGVWLYKSKLMSLYINSERWHLYYICNCLLVKQTHHWVELSLLLRHANPTLPSHPHPSISTTTHNPGIMQTLHKSKSQAFPVPYKSHHPRRVTSGIFKIIFSCLPIRYYESHLRREYVFMCKINTYRWHWQLHLLLYYLFTQTHHWHANSSYGMQRYHL